MFLSSPHILGQPGGAHLPKRPRPIAQESPPVPGPKNTSHHLLRALMEIPLLDLSPTSIIKQPYFHNNLIRRNVDCSAKDLHNEIYYDLLAFAEDPELRDSMRLVQRYSLETFITPHRFFLSSSGHRVLPHNDLQTRAKFDSHSFLNRWPTRDTSGHRYSSHVQSTGGPRQLGRL